MSRERELLQWSYDILECIGWQIMPVPRETFKARLSEISAILSQPEAEPSKTVYSVLATAYRPDQQADQFTVDYPTQGILREVNQHEASMAAVERHKGETPETDDLLFEVNEGRIYDQDGPVAEHARRLERQRDELRAENEKLKDALNMATEGKYSALMLELTYEMAKQMHDALQVSILKGENEELRSKLNKGE